MSATYTDIQTLHEAAQPAEQIAAALAADPRTMRSIPRPDLRAWLSETGLLRSGATGWSGWLVTLVATVPSIAPVIDWLCDALANPDLTHLRTDTSEAVAGGLAAMQAAIRAAPDGAPVTVEQIDAQLLTWTGGRLYDGVTVEQVQALIDEREKVVIMDACREAMAEALKPLLAKDSAINAWLDALDVSGLTVEDVQIYCDALLASEDGNPE